MESTFADTEQGYSKVAQTYAQHFFHELDNKPLDRDLLARFAEAMQGQGVVCEIGCGPGQISRFLRDPYPDVEHPSRRAYIFARKPILD